MRKLLRDKKGQFIIIAFLMMAIMMISMGAIIHRAGTYYKHEPWEEYLTLVSDIEVNTRRLVELSLANYTNTNSSNILSNNLRKWQTDLNAFYPGYGIALDYTLANGIYQSIPYSSGLKHVWDQSSSPSYSAANASIVISINAIGLSGYKFTATSLVKLRILNVTTNQIALTVEKENDTPVFDLTQNSFQVMNNSITSIYSKYDGTYVYVYVLTCNNPITGSVTVNLWDQRGIRVTATHS